MVCSPSLPLPYNRGRELVTDGYVQSSKVKAGQLWGKSKDELSKQLEELKTELNQLRVQKISSGASTKTQKMCVSTRFPFPGLFYAAPSLRGKDDRGLCDWATAWIAEAHRGRKSATTQPSTAPNRSAAFKNDRVIKIPEY